MKYNSLYYTVNPCCLSILCIVVAYISPKFLIYPSPFSFPFGNHKSVFCVCDCVSVLSLDSFVLFFRFYIVSDIYLSLFELV